MLLFALAKLTNGLINYFNVSRHFLTNISFTIRFVLIVLQCKYRGKERNSLIKLHTAKTVRKKAVSATDQSDKLSF